MDEKKKQVYGGAYDQQINDLYGQLTSRPDFNYSVDDDALYQQYKDRYVQSAKRSAKDTMGQAAGLTGGYGSTYSQGVAQQAYDETMRGLTDKIPELSDRAYQRYKDQGDQILTQFNLANQLGAADQATRLDQRNWDFQQQQYADQRADNQRDWEFQQRQYADTRGDIERNWDFTQSQYGDSQAQQAYGNLSSAILSSGYQPNDAELAAAGMTREQANALRQAWIGSNPGLAYMQGMLSAEDYYKLTGQMPPGTAKAAGGGGNGGGPSSTTKQNVVSTVQQELNKVGYNINVTGEPDLATRLAMESYMNRDASAYWSSQPTQKRSEVLDTLSAGKSLEDVSNAIRKAIK